MSVHNILHRIFTPIVNKQYGIRHLSNALTSGKDVKQTVSPPDILMNKFKQAGSTKDVLNTVHQHEKVMNAKHIMQALRSLFVLQKEGRSDLSTRNIIKSREFRNLCGRLKSLAGVIDTNETIEALKIVTYVGVPKDSTIVLVLLQLLRHNVNDLSLSNIMFLEFLLGHYSGVPLADALKIALPIVFEIQMPVKMERDNLSNLREYLYFASRNKLSNKSVDLILLNMLKCNDVPDTTIAKSIVWSLVDLPHSPYSEPLLKKNLDTLVVHLDELSYDDMDSTLSKLANVYKTDYPFVRNELFCDAVVSHIIDKDIGFQHAMYTLRKLDRLGVVNQYLIDYVSKKIEEDNIFKSDANIHNIYLFLKYLAKTDYKPSNWDFIVNMVENLKVVTSKDVIWLKYAAAMSYHQIFNEDILMKCMSEDLESQFRKRTSHVYLFLSIYHSLKLYRTELLRLIPRHLRIKDLIQYLLIPEDFPLEGALYNAFGGEKYVKTKMYSREAIFIDHVIVFRTGGYPVATNCKATFVEDLEVSSENEVVLIMRMTPELYTEENRLKIGPALSLKMLEDLGFKVVPICWTSWLSLADYEKIPYLVQHVKEKLGPDMLSANSTT